MLRNVQGEGEGGDCEYMQRALRREGMRESYGDRHTSKRGISW